MNHYTFYYLTFIGLDRIVANLYSDFNNRLDLISNLAENRLKKESTSAIDEIYERNEKLLKRQLASDALNDANSGNKPKMKEIEKLIDVLSPYYYLGESKNYRADKGHIFSQDHESFRGEDDDERNSWYNREGDGAGMNCNFASRGYKWASREGVEPKEPMRDAIKLVLRNLTKRYSLQGTVADPKPIMNSAPSLYPSVIAKSADLASPRLDVTNSNSLPAGLNLQDLAVMGNGGPKETGGFTIQSLNQLKNLEDYLLHNTPPTDQLTHQYSRSPGSLNSEQAPNSSNTSNILDRVLNELEAIREFNMGNLTEDGTPCAVSGFWNAEIAGVRFDITTPKNVNNSVSLKIDIHTRRTPAKEPVIMDTTWNCTGITMNTTGGPFHMTAVSKSGNVSGTFSGYCMKCGGCDTVFGSWTFIYPCKSCAEMSTAIETKRDVFRRDLEEERKAREKKGKTKPKKREKFSNYNEKVEYYYMDDFEDLGKFNGYQ